MRGLQHHGQWVARTTVFLLLAAGLALTGRAESLLYAPFTDAPGTVPPAGWTNQDAPSDDGVATNSLSVPSLKPSTGNRFGLDNSTSMYTSPTWPPFLQNSGKTIYYSLLLRVDDLGTMTAGNNQNASILIGDESDGASFGGQSQAGIGLKLDDDNPAAWNVVFSAEHRGVSNGSSIKDTNEFFEGETVFLVAGFEIASSGNSGTGRIWINPPTATFGAATPPAEDHSQVDNTTGDEFDCILVFEGSSALGIPADWSIDEVRVGTNWAEVTPADACVDPTQLSMSGTGTFCTTDGPRVFGVTGATETNVTYELRLNGSVIETATGTTAAIAFSAQTATGTWTVAGVNGSCETLMTGQAVIEAEPTAEAGPDQTVGRGEAIQLAGSVGGAATGGVWSGGSGVFDPDAQTLDATYTASLAEKTNGTVTLTLTSVGDFTACTAAVDTVTFTLTNGFPVADSAAVNTLTNTAVEITLTATDPDSDPLTYTVTLNPTNGSLTGTEPTLTYDPDPGFVGTDSLVFLVNDGSVDSAAATVTISVTESPVNNPPVAGDDTAVVTAGSLVTINVLTNDTDPDLDPLSIDSVETPAQGTAVINGDAIDYTAPSAFTGLVAFSYVVTDGAATATGLVSVTVLAAPVAEALLGKEVRLYFLGNSLTRGLSSASGQDRARLESLFRYRGSRMEFGTQLGAGVNLDEHVVKLRLTVTVPQPLNLTYMDDWTEYGSSDTNDFGQATFGDYTFALDGRMQTYDGGTNTGNVFDGLVLQPYLSHIEHEAYDDDDRAKADRGDRRAISNFVTYAMGGNPSGEPAVERVYIYSAWPRLEGIETRAVDDDADGVYTFSEFYAAPYTVTNFPADTPDAGRLVPSRDYLDQLWQTITNDLAGTVSRPLRLIPVGEVMTELDGLIRSNRLPGISNYVDRNAAYYLNARLDGETNLTDAGFVFLYPPGQPGNFTSDFIREQGVKNVYADKVHMNDQTHNDENAGTIGAYAAAATVFSVISGERPQVHTAADVAAAYEKFDPAEDAVLIQAIQDAIWRVVTSTNRHGIDFAERTGLADLPPRAVTYDAFAAFWFTPAELADPLVSGRAADADGDRATNLEEFYRQTDPTDALVDAGVDIAAPSGVVYEGLRHSSALLADLQVSDDLQTWSNVPGAEVSIEDIGDDLERVTYRSEGGQTRFYRYRLSAVPGTNVLPLVSWGGSTNIVSSSPGMAAGTGTVTVDTNTPANPTIGASYYPDAVGACPLFYAAAAPLSGNSMGSHRINNADPDSDMILTTFEKGAAAVNHGVLAYIWKRDGDGSQYGFLNGADTNDVTLANLFFRGRVNANTGPTELRFILQVGETWVISNNRGAITANTFLEEKDLANPYAVTWYAFDPTDISIFGEPVDVPGFDDINAVGFHWRCYVSGGFQSLFVERFTANFFAP